MKTEIKLITLKIVEIFYSIQGEGEKAGEASIFIRLAKCNLNCWFCDTDWSRGNDMTLSEIMSEIKQYPASWIVWTGGEPTIQLNAAIIAYFKSAGYSQAIETNGTNPVPEGIDYIACSPKKEVSLQTLHTNFPNGVEEFRFVIEVTGVPLYKLKELPKADNYFISPVFLGEKKKRFKLDYSMLKTCVQFVKDHPEWKLSVQQHKILGIR